MGINVIIDARAARNLAAAARPTLWWDYQVKLTSLSQRQQRLIRLSLREPSQAGTGSIIGQ